MPDADHIIATINAHLRTLTEHDKEGWLALWADDVVLEDPVGVDTFEGIDALRNTFWKMVEEISPMTLWLEREIIICGNEAIAILHGGVTREGKLMHVGPIVDHFTFNDDGKIAKMRAFWKYA